MQGLSRDSCSDVVPMVVFRAQIGNLDLFGNRNLQVPHLFRLIVVRAHAGEPAFLFKRLHVQAVPMLYECGKQAVTNSSGSPLLSTLLWMLYRAEISPEHGFVPVSDGGNGEGARNRNRARAYPQVRRALRLQSEPGRHVQRNPMPLALATAGLPPARLSRRRAPSCCRSLHEA
jgi:hypothetical protein